MLNQAKALQSQITLWRRSLHTMPEIGLALTNTAAYVRSVLDQLEIPYQTYLDGHAMVATIGKDPSNTVALRADMDGLPINEETGLDFASTNGCMHACGHDSHTAMLLGAAALLKQSEQELQGTVKLIFQPGEEIFAGAEAMIHAGVLEPTAPKHMLALHIEPMEDCQTGQVVITRGSMMASADFIDINIKGRGVHASMPELGADPITAAAQVINAIQTMVAREFSPLDSLVVSLCSLRSKMTEDGEDTVVYNVIPGYVHIAGTIRTLSEAAREKLLKRTREVVEGVCASLCVEGQFTCRQMSPVLINDDVSTETFLGTCHKLYDASDIVFAKNPIMGSDDAAFFLNKIPGTYFQIVSNAYRDGTLYPAHNSKFMIDESMLYRGSALLAQGAVDLLTV